MITSLDLMINYYALTVAILAPATPELAFNLLESNNPEKSRRYRQDITLEDDVDMLKIYNTGEMTYREIGEMYLISDVACYNRIRRTGERRTKKTG